MVNPVLVSSFVRAKVTDKRAVITIIPESNFEIWNLTCKTPVITPAISPAKKLRSIAGRAGMPSFNIKIVQITPPRGKVPSTERSGKSRIE